jgi:Tn3 transposase DDE domain
VFGGLALAVGAAFAAGGAEGGGVAATFRGEVADLPDQKLWRIDPHADYGPFTTAVRGRINLERVRRHWEDILRVVASIHTGTVRAHDVIRMLSRDATRSSSVRPSPATAGSARPCTCCVPPMTSTTARP